MKNQTDDSFLSRAESLVRTLIKDYYNKNCSVEDLYQYVAPDCSWIAAGRGEFFPDMHEAKVYFKAQEEAQDVPYIYIDDEEFHTSLLAPQTALVYGRYRCHAGRSLPLLDEVQRCTFIIEQEHEGGQPDLKVRHIHISNPWYLMRGTEMFPQVIFGEDELELARELTKEKLPKDIGLSVQQNKVLSFLGLGLTYEEIAKKMDISARTVRYHVEQIMNKFYVTNRQELMLRYMRHIVKKRKEENQG